MSLAGQRLDPRRYTVVPRTLSLLVRGDEVLLLRLSADRGDWAGRLNGLGGHIEPGEYVLNSARREIREEAGLSPGDLRLCGVVMIDIGLGFLLVLLATVMVWRLIDLFKPKGRWAEEAAHELSQEVVK